MITFDPDAVASRIAELEQELGQPGFWDDQSHAARVSTEHSRLTRRLERYERLQREYDDAAELLELEPGLVDEIETQLQPLRARARRGCRRTRSSTASTTAATRSSRSMQAPAAPTRRTGRR